MSNEKQTPSNVPIQLEDKLQDKITYYKCLGCNRIYDPFAFSWNTPEEMKIVYDRIKVANPLVKLEIVAGYYSEHCIAKYLAIKLGNRPVIEQQEVYVKYLVRLNKLLGEGTLESCSEDTSQSQQYIKELNSSLKIEDEEDLDSFLGKKSKNEDDFQELDPTCIEEIVDYAIIDADCVEEVGDYDYASIQLKGGTKR
jgi:hypothetical protein